MVDAERQIKRKQAYNAANKDAINKKRGETSSVPSNRDEIDRKQRERYAAKKQKGVQLTVDPPIDGRTLILPRVPACTYCGAYKFYNETANFCCSLGQFEKRNGGIYTVQAQGPIKHFLNDLFLRDSLVPMTGNHLLRSAVRKAEPGICTVRAQGPIKHFYDPAEQTANRTAALPRLRDQLLLGLFL
ncbi:hypothetical protein LIER_34737 [Lithospermum erythrorhizon]|uniref:Uncharacterized protein n=1 Tax=Lithospermum erythrorhizon TaxID=34254 RepID=A0AAV3S146_LITER